MKTRVLAKTEQEIGGWVATAYQGEGAFSTAHDSLELGALAKLRDGVKKDLIGQIKAWINVWKHGGSPHSPNCPEGAVKLPIDTWVCKLVGETCPIQAQVVLHEPETFFRLCLATEERKQRIFEAVSQGKYDGFHHVPGRHLCVRCRDDKKKLTFQYHYPWELTHAKAYLEFSSDEQWVDFCSDLIRKGLNPAIKYSALCAPHCKEVAAQLDPGLGTRLTVLEFVLQDSGTRFVG